VNNIFDFSKPVFICGNGQSFTKEIRSDLIGEYTIGVNQVGLCFDSTYWRPDIYVGITTALFDPRHTKYVLRGINESLMAICWDKYKGFDGITQRNIVYVPCSREKDIDYPPEEATNDYWSDNILERLDKFGVSAFSAMQVACWLGFKKIYLIGCDGNYRPPQDGKDLSHFSESYRPFDAYPDYDYDELNRALLKAHEIAEINSKRLGVEITNLSPVSVIESHKRMKFEDVI